MADYFDFSNDAPAYELPEDSFSRPSSSYLDLGGFTYIPDDTTNPLLQTSQEKYDTDMAAQLGMPLDAYLAISNPGAEGSQQNSNPPQFDVSSVDDWQKKLKSVGDALGLTKTKGGDYDWSKIIGLGAAGMTAYDAMNQQQQPVKSPAQLLAGMPSNAPSGLSPQVLAAMQSPMRAGNQIQGQYAADMPSTIRGGLRGYADGGEVEGPLSRTFDSSAEQGFVGGGEGGGQDDMVEARLSPGEYVFDAESVSMLGDGDNAAGARKLDELRMAMREHKRSASPDEIAPKSLGPLSYLNGGQNG